MANLTEIDARMESTTLKALEDSLVSGVAAPVIWFGDFASVALQENGQWGIMALGLDGIIPNLTTSETVALLNKWARSRA